MKIKLKISKFIIILIVVVVAFFATQRLESNLLFYPSHNQNTGSLDEWFILDEYVGLKKEIPEPECIWLFLHGNAGQAENRDYVIHYFSEKDSVYIMEYPGYGPREGKPSDESFNKAAEQVFRFLQKNHVDKPVCIVGESIGSGPASYLGSLKSPPEKIYLLAPFDRIRDVAKNRVPNILVDLLMDNDWDNVTALKQYENPVVIFAMNRDQVIPFQHAKNLHNNLKNSKFTLLNGNHNQWGHHKEVEFRYP